MKSIVVGVGKVGSTLVEKLINEGHDVSAIDLYPERVEHVADKFDIKGFVGSGAEREIMISAGVQNADFFIACSSRDEFNILVCVLAKKNGAKKVIARVRDPRYFNEVEHLKNDLGIDMIFNPEYRTALEIAKIIKFPSALSIEGFAGGKANMVEIEVKEGNPIINKTVVEIVGEFKPKVIIAMVNRDGEVFIPNGDFTILEGDFIHVIGAEEDITYFFKKMHVYKMHAKSVFIVGGGMVSYYLVNALDKKETDIKILENDKKRCEELASTLKKVTVLLGDGSNTEVLDEVDIKNADACVTLTGSDELNVITSLYAISKKVDKVITKIDTPSLDLMADRLGLNSVVSPRSVIANHIIRFVRAHREDESNGMKHLYMLEEGVDAIDFIVKDNFKKIGCAIKNIKFKKNIIIGGIIRDGQYILPTGDVSIEVGDRVVIVCKKSLVNELNDIVSR